MTKFLPNKAFKLTAAGQVDFSKNVRSPPCGYRTPRIHPTPALSACQAGGVLSLTAVCVPYSLDVGLTSFKQIRRVTIAEVNILEFKWESTPKVDSNYLRGSALERFIFAIDADEM